MSSFFDYFADKNALVLEAFGAYLPSALVKIQSYLERELENTLVPVGTVENFIDAAGNKSRGQKYVIHNTADMIRLNFTGSGRVESLDVWSTGASADIPSFHIEVEDALIVQVLPQIAELLKGKLKPIVLDVEVLVNEDLLQESSGKLSDIVNFLATGPKKAQEIRNEFNQYAIRQLEQIMAKNPETVIIDATGKYTITVTPDQIDLEGLGRNAKVSVTVGRQETHIAAPKEAKEDKQMQDRIPPEVLFERFETLVRMLAKGGWNSLIVVGTGGIGKTYTVDKVLKAEGKTEIESGREGGHMEGDYAIRKGNASPLGIYDLLYTFRDKLLVLDDIDSVFKNTVATNILKAALDSGSKKRIVGWKSPSTFPTLGMTDEEIQDQYDSYDYEKRKYPDRFEFKGQVIFISNLQKNMIDGAITSRSIVFELFLNQKEVLDYIENRIGGFEPIGEDAIKLEALEALREMTAAGTATKMLTIRSFQSAVSMRMTGEPKWKDLVSYA